MTTPTKATYQNRSRKRAGKITITHADGTTTTVAPPPRLPVPKKVRDPLPQWQRVEPKTPKKPRKTPKKSPKSVNKQQGDRIMTIKKQMILCDIAKCDSKRKPGTHYYRFTFIEPEEYTKYESVIDPDMKNYNARKWNRLVNDHKPYGIYTVGVLPVKNRAGLYIIDADIQAQLVQRLTDEQLVWLLTNLDELHKNAQVVQKPLTTT